MLFFHNHGDVLLTGCVCLLDASQVLTPWTQIGRHHPYFPFYINFLNILASYTAISKPLLCRHYVIERKTVRANVETELPGAIGSPGV